MKFQLKGVFRELWPGTQRAEALEAERNPGEAVAEDEESLEVEVPYKLEPSQDEVDAFLDRIRSGGW